MRAAALTGRLCVAAVWLQSTPVHLNAHVPIDVALDVAAALGLLLHGRLTTLRRVSDL
jgi:hypothetical protein